MRVVGGSAKGRALTAVPGDGTRPIMDRVKTSLFDILRPSLEGTRWLDLFGGSGSVGIEALSQGAAFCTFTELNPRAVETIKKNLAHTKLESQSSVRLADAFRFLRSSKDSFDIIYIAPPQYKGLWIEAVRTIAERPDLVTASGSMIIQIDPKENEELTLSDFEKTDERRYGNTVLVFFKRKVPPQKH